MRAGGGGGRLRTAIAASVAAWLIGGGPSLACEDASTCLADCAAICAGDEACLERCSARCMAALEACEPAAGAAPAEAQAAPPPPPAPAAPAVDPRVQTGAATAAASDTAVAPLEARILFLPRGIEEPAARFYGYILIGDEVARDRKNAVAEGFACRIDALPDADAAAEVAALGLVVAPATRGAGAETTSPAAMLEAYDFPRAGAWLRAAAAAAEADFDLSDAVLFIGSRQPRARQLDSVALPGPGDLGDPVIADASLLSPRYLSRWTAEVIEGVKSGTIASRQDMQGLMEAHSAFERLGDPLAAWLQIGEAEAAPRAACF